ncbi:OmpA family protein [Leisingera methylohalidivorans]|uniref:Cell envelope biogenesis protein OmpA n=1 Tax=Leisingera methylohalidivorans DSM 14336 TaxID=999552 RepID=V9VW59_9RHOB|nr:cell envelope biogenesis protein OmpA [Leisingera methylohalidivorans DSM 14336]
MLTFKFNKAIALAAAAAAALSIAAAPASAQSGQRTIKGERYIPTIWVDPDGCEHWVMDDGAEGFMTPHVTPDGKPVCRRGNICGVMPTDQFFATDKHHINAAGRQRLGKFFQQAISNGARAFVVAGHTDSRASDEYNIRLSQRRAHAVAQAGRSVGARINDVRAYGERDPRVPNTSAGNMAQNRRVEIYCLR